MKRDEILKHANKYVKSIKKEYPKEIFDKTAIVADFTAGYNACISNFNWMSVSVILPKNTKPVLVKGNTPSGRETIQVGRLYKSGWVTDTYFEVDVKEWKPID